MKFLRKIKKQPPAVREHILKLVTFISFVLLIFIWVTTLGYRFGDEKRLTRDTVDERSGKPFKLLGSGVKDLVENLSASAQKTGEKIE